MPVSLLALAAGAFGIGTTEFIIMGLLTQVSESLGISILSTSSGVVSDREARQRKLGGEVLCELW